MTFLPIVQRELRVAARRRGTYWMRMLVAAVLILATIWIFFASENAPAHQVGQIIFYALTGGLLLYCLLAGVRATADCLSEEKREGTLGLLFLTDLRGYDVVIGKLTANSLPVFYCVLAVLPVLALPLLMGGVTGAEFGRIALVLLNTLFFSLGVGMFASACCQNQRVATALTMLLILLVAAGSPALGLAEWWLRDWHGSIQLGFLLPSPVFTYYCGVDALYGRVSGWSYFWSLGIVHGLAWSFLMLASFIAPRSWHDKAVSVGGQRRREWLRSTAEGDANLRQTFRARALDRNPFYWLATRPRSRALWSWLPLILTSFIWAWGLAQTGTDWLDPSVYVITAYALSVAMKGMIGAEAGRHLLADRKSGALELLLTTPLTVRQIVRGQWLSLRRVFLPPVLVMLAADVWMCSSGMLRLSGWGGDQSFWFLMWFAALVVFVTDVVALVWLGMWTGLATRNPRRAFGATVLPVLALPWVGFGVVMTIVALLPYQIGQQFEWDGWPLLLWFGFSLGTDLLFGLAARRKLLRDFRTVATQRYRPKPSWWQRWFGKTGD